MRSVALVSLSLLILCGCSHPLHLFTSSEVSIKEPIETRLQVMNELGLKGTVTGNVQMDSVVANKPTYDGGPLLEVSVSDLGVESAPAKVALIDLDGLLLNSNPVGLYSSGENPVALFREKLTAAAHDAAIKAVVLRINSPGGGVAAADIMWSELKRFRKLTCKPVVACVLDLGAGGAYYLACGCDRVVALPTALVGGIGVVLNLYYMEKALEIANVFDASISSGERVNMGTPVRKQTAQEKEAFTAIANEYHDRFKEIVRQGRPLVPAKSEVFDGRIMTASQAAKAGLVDSVGYLPDAVALACQLANLDSARVVLFRRKDDPGRSAYATTANQPIQGNLFPYSLPGHERSRLPQFLYIWEPEPTILRQAGL